MGKREKQDQGLIDKRVANDLKVIRYLMDNVSHLASGQLESPAKLTVFYAGYTAMRSLWEVKTSKGERSTGDPKLDGIIKSEEGKLVFRINMEISHSLGVESKTLLRVVTFKFWAKHFLRVWG